MVIFLQFLCNFHGHFPTIPLYISWSFSYNFFVKFHIGKILESRHDLYDIVLLLHCQIPMAMDPKYSQCSHRLEKYLNLEDFLEKSLRIKSVLKSTGKFFIDKSLESYYFL